jgi:hypothetical protein
MKSSIELMDGKSFISWVLELCATCVALNVMFLPLKIPDRLIHLMSFTLVGGGQDDVNSVVFADDSCHLIFSGSDDHTCKVCLS